MLSMLSWWWGSKFNPSSKTSWMHSCLSLCINHLYYIQYIIYPYLYFKRDSGGGGWHMATFLSFGLRGDWKLRERGPINWEKRDLKSLTLLICLLETGLPTHLLKIREFVVEIWRHCYLLRGWVDFNSIPLEREARASIATRYPKKEGVHSTP